MSSQSVVSQTPSYLGTNSADTLQDFQTHLVLLFQTSGKRRAYGGFCTQLILWSALSRGGFIF